MFTKLQQINHRPKPFEHYTAKELWVDPHIAQKMLSFHLDSTHDIASKNSVFIDHSVTWMTSYFKLCPHSKVLDLGCGPGLYSNRLAHHSLHVTGVDFSPSSIAYAQKEAKQNNLTVTYLCDDYLKIELREKFDLIIMIMYDYCALSSIQRVQLLQKIDSVLKDEGFLLLDVFSLNAYHNREETVTYSKNLMNGFWSPSPYYGFLHTFKYEQEKIILDKYTILEEHKEQVIYNWLQYFSPTQIEQEFATHGFSVYDILGDVSGKAFNASSEEFALIAQKKA